MGRRIRELMQDRDPAWTYTELHNKIIEVTRGDPDGPVDISPATLWYIVNGYTDRKDGSEKVRRLAAGELYGIARAFGRTSDWFLGMEDG